MIQSLAAVGGLLMFTACVWHVLFHWPVRRRMAVEDFMTRGGWLVLMADAGWVAVALVFGVDVWPSYPPLIALLVAGTLLNGGQVAILVRYRFSRSTAALQPLAGNPPKPRRFLMSTVPSPMNPITTTSQLTPDGIAGYAKAIGAFIVPLIALVIDAWADGSITTAEWKTIAIAAVTAAVAAFSLPNAIKPTPPAPIEPATD